MARLLLGALFLIIYPLLSFADTGNGKGLWGWCTWMFRRGGGGFMMMVPLILVIILLYYLMKERSAKNSSPPTTDTPMEILKRRYANGEITKEEFEKMKKDL